MLCLTFLIRFTFVENQGF